MRRSRFALPFSAFILLFSCPALAPAQSARFSVRVNSDGESFSLFLDHDVAVTGGSAGLVIDPGVLRLEAVQQGSALASLPDGATVVSNLFSDSQSTDSIPVTDPAPVFDEAGNEVPGGVLIGWFNGGLFDPGNPIDPVLPAGEDREIFIFYPFTGDGFDACAAVDFVEGLAAAPSAPPQRNIVTNEDASQSIPASTEDTEVCLGPEVMTVLAPAPAEVVIDNGGRAIAFAGSFAAPPLTGARLGRLVFQNVGAGDAARLVTRARLHADDDGDGVFTDADPAVAVADLIDPETQEVAFAGAGVTIPPGETLRLFLVLDLAEGAAAGSIPPALPAPGLDPRFPALALISLLLVLLARSAWSARSLAPSRLASFAARVLVVGLLASCGGGGGDGPAAASSNELRIRLVDASAVDDATGRSIRVEGLPITAWSFSP